MAAIQSSRRLCTPEFRFGSTRYGSLASLVQADENEKKWARNEQII